VSFTQGQQGQHIQHGHTDHQMSTQQQLGVSYILQVMSKIKYTLPILLDVVMYTEVCLLDKIKERKNLYYSMNAVVHPLQI